MDAVTLAVAQRRSGILSVKPFGAKGDGVTDDSAAIQAACDAAASMGLSVYVPPGNYVAAFVLLSAGTHDGLRVFGAGAGRSVLTFLPHTVPDNGHYAPLEIRGTSEETIKDVLVENLEIDGNKANITLAGGVSGFNVECINLEYAERCIVRNVVVRNGVSEGVDWDNCTECLCDTVWMYDCNGYGNHFSTGTNKCRGVSLTAVRCGSGGRGGMDFFTNTSGNSYEHCRAIECHVGFNATSGWQSFVNCWAVDYKRYGFRAEGSGSEGTEFTSCTVNGYSEIMGTSHGFLIEGNRCNLVGCRSRQAKEDGFHVDGNSVTVTGCRSQNAGGNGLTIDGSNGIFVNNHFLTSSGTSYADNGSDNILENNLPAPT